MTQLKMTTKGSSRISISRRISKFLKIQYLQLKFVSICILLHCLLHKRRGYRILIDINSSQTRQTQQYIASRDKSIRRSATVPQSDSTTKTGIQNNQIQVGNELSRSAIMDPRICQILLGEQTNEQAYKQGLESRSAA